MGRGGRGDGRKRGSDLHVTGGRRGVRMAEVEPKLIAGGSDLG